MSQGSVGEPLVVGALGAGALWFVNPPTPGTPWCPSVLLFDVACPLCGLTRGIARLVRGDLDASWAFHPLAGWILLVTVAAWVAWFGRRMGWWTWRSRRLERTTVVTTVLALTLVWVARAAAGTLPTISG